METCDRPHLARGYCKPHYRRWVNYANPTAGSPLPEDRETFPSGFKRCVKCDHVKPLERFSPDKKRALGRASYCKPCASENVTRLNRTPKGERRKPGRESTSKVDRSPGSGNELNPKQKHTYPGDRALVEAMKRFGTFAEVAQAHGVPWSCMKDWLNARPALRAKLEQHRPPPPTEEERLAERRSKGREYQRRVRAENPEKARASRREQMRGYGPEYRRRWNTYNRLRREKDGGPMTQEAVEYLEIIQGDPCSYCGEPMEHADHIHPIHLGGDNSWDNFTAACAACNMRKKASRLLLFLLRRNQTTTEGASHG